MTVSERIPFSGLLLPLQEGHTYSCDRCTTDGMELLFVFRENGHSRYYFESDMQGFDRKAASDSSAEPAAMASTRPTTWTTPSAMSSARE